MAKPFFPQDWETLTAEDLATARARLAGFIEAVPDHEKVLREPTTTTRRLQFNQRRIDREKYYLSAGALISQHGPVAEKCQNLTCLTNVMSEKIE
uniref:Uncharacterized protein n=1 Tax=Daphnia galeata TaxID=27404 RepID=A0A8J2WMH5_9CRUS|nr:unnamed protein product [Daphnia galeata]